MTTEEERLERKYRAFPWRGPVGSRQRVKQWVERGPNRIADSPRFKPVYRNGRVEWWEMHDDE